MTTATEYVRPAALGFLLVVAACAPFAAPDPSPGNPTPTDSAQAPPRASARPSSASLGDQYLALLEPLNDAACEFDTIRHSPGAGRVVVQPATEDLADAMRAFVDATGQVEWPDDTQAAIDDLTRGMEVQEAALRAALDSRDNQSFFDNVTAAQEARAATGPAALLVRTTLGLEGLRQTCTDP